MHIRDIVETNPKDDIFSMFGHAVTLTFDFLTSKLDAFTLAPKCNNAESLVKICPILFKILC